MNPEQKPPLTIRNEFDEIRKMYQDDPRSKTFNALITGESGSGKTFLVRTARAPIHVDSFDPGGSKNLRDLVDCGNAAVDSRFEVENPMNPTAFELWERETERRIKEGYFDNIQTYVLDSLTMWSAAIMNRILKKAGIPGQTPRRNHDYMPQKTIIANWLKRLLSLPCDVIVTGHLKAETDDDGRISKYKLLTTGDGYVTVPMLFDELWVMQPKETSKGIQYRILTQATGIITARSRLAKEGLLEQYEEANLKKILEKTKLI